MQQFPQQYPGSHLPRDENATDSEDLEIAARIERKRREQQTKPKAPLLTHAQYIQKQKSDNSQSLSNRGNPSQISA